MVLPLLLTRHSDGNLYIGSRLLKEEEILASSGPCQVEIPALSDRRLNEAIRRKAKSFEMDIKAKGLFGIIGYEVGGGTVVQCLGGHSDLRSTLSARSPSHLLVACVSIADTLHEVVRCRCGRYSVDMACVLDV